MPFNSSGTYTPAAGATTAAPGDVIKSATWNSIFTDISNALTSLGKQVYGFTSVSSTPYVPLSADATLFVSTGGGAKVVNLTTGSSRAGYPLVIKDADGGAATNNITINAHAGDTIEGLAFITINVAFGGYSLFPVTGGWIIKP